MAWHEKKGGALVQVPVARNPLSKGILKHGAKYTHGKDTWDNNILAAKVLGDLMRTSLGPNGFDKMFKHNEFDVIVTNDGRTILDQLKLQHPIAKMIAEASKWVDLLVGDGTTTVALLTSSFLCKARPLLEMGVHPNIIADGYLDSMEKSLEILEKLAIPVEPLDKEQLLKIALTSLMTKVPDDADLHYVAGLVVDAILRVTEKRPWGYIVEKDSIHIVKKYGTFVRNSSLINGLAIWREATSGSMPTRIEKAKIALVSSAFQIRKMTVGKPENLDHKTRADESVRQRGTQYLRGDDGQGAGEWRERRRLSEWPR